MKKFLIFVMCLFALSANAKETTYTKELFDKAKRQFSNFKDVYGAF